MTKSLIFMFVLLLLWPYIVDIFHPDIKSSFYEETIRVENVRMNKLKILLKDVKCEIYSFSWLYGSFSYVSFDESNEDPIYNILESKVRGIKIIKQ